MPALTEFLGKPIRDPNGEAVAALHDLVVRLPQTETPANPMDIYPPVIGVVARVKGPRGSRDIFIPLEEVVAIQRPRLSGLRASACRDSALRLTLECGDAVVDRWAVLLRVRPKGERAGRYSKRDGRGERRHDSS